MRLTICYSRTASLIGCGVPGLLFSISLVLRVDPHARVPARQLQEICVGPIKYVGQKEMQRDVENFVKALRAANHPIEDAFLQ
jgi:hypothetical protein